MSSIMLETRDTLPFPSNYEQHHKRQKGSQHCEQQTALLISQMTLLPVYLPFISVCLDK